MECSANELTALLYKATVGCGFPIGLAQDAARASVWLTARGHRGVEALLDALATVDQDAASMPDQSCLQRSLSAVDLVLAGRREPVTLTSLRQPLLVLGFAGIVAEDRFGPFTIDFATGASAVVDKGDVTLAGSCPDQCDVTIHPCDTTPSPGHAMDDTYVGSISVDDELWRRATALAAHTYVPATEASRLKGAGAGLTDND